MAEQQMSFTGSRGLALGRAAEAMLRTLGGCEVALRFPVVLATSGNARLGTAPASAEDVPVSPVVVRSIKTSDKAAQLEFVLAASTVARLVEQRGTSSEELFRSAAGIVYQDKLFRLTDVATDFYAGAAYLYRVSACE